MEKVENDIYTVRSFAGIRRLNGQEINWDIIRYYPLEDVYRVEKGKGIPSTFLSMISVLKKIAQDGPLREAILKLNEAK